MNLRYLDYIDDWCRLHGRAGRSLLYDFTMLMCTENIPPMDWMTESELLGENLVRKYKPSTRRNYKPILRNYITYVVQQEQKAPSECDGGIKIHARP